MHKNDTFAHGLVSCYGPSGAKLQSRLKCSGIQHDIGIAQNRTEKGRGVILCRLLTKCWVLRPLLVQLRLPRPIAQSIRSMFACAFA
jgi:hypothetical protein